LRLPSNTPVHQSWLALAIVVLLATNATSADEISGFVINTNTAVAGAEVAFLLSGEGGLNELLRKNADAEGRFSFSGPFLNAGVSFVLVAFHNGVPYPSSALEVGAQQEILLEVFDPTDDDSSVRIRNHHLFLSVHADHVEVSQLMHIENSGDRTYVGVVSGDERRVTEFWLPEGVFGLESHSGQMTGLVGHRLAHTQPLVPGTTQIAFTYRLDNDQFDGTYIHVSPFATNILDVYLQPATIELDAPFVDMGEIDLHGQNYRSYRLERLTSRQQLEVELPLQISLRWALKWAVLALALSAGVVAIVVSRPWDSADRSVTPDLSPPSGQLSHRNERADLERQRREILAALAGLEEGGSDHQQAAYRHLMDQAIELYVRLEDHGEVKTDS
jgi:hypothetical protein